MSFSPTPAPEDFAAYWSAVMAELDALPPAPELTHNALRSNEHCDVYDLRLTSIGPYRIFAFYSIPKGDGPFPVNYHIGGYGSVVHIAPYEERQQYVTVALRHRGQRLADQPLAAAYPGLLTTGIDDPMRYIYRGVVADCCRVIDFLVTRPEVDAAHISVVGDDLALLTAALRPQVDSVYATPALFYGAQQMAPRTNAYPLEELNDYARAYPEKAAAMWRTLSYFDPIHVAGQIQAETQLTTGNDKDLFTPEVIAPLAAAFGRAPSQYVSAHSSYRDGVVRARSQAERYGLAEVMLPPHWRD